jgi:two-component system response regulator DesR
VIRVLLAEDQVMFRTAVRRLLELEGDLEVVAEVARGDEVVAAALVARPDVAVVDIEMPGQDGISAASELRQSLPSCRTLILTMYGRPGYVRRSMEEGGVSGFLLKDAPVEVLAGAIRRCAAGEEILDPTLAARALRATLCPLSRREREILAACADGLSGAELVTRLWLSEGTIRNRVSEILGKLGVRNRADAVLMAKENGWL